jgi:methyl-accepting chemotaxis protein
MTESQKNRRRQFLVDKPFQFRTAFGGLPYILGVAAIMAVPLFKMMGTIELLLIGQEPELRESYEALRFNTLALLLVFVTVIIAVWMVAAIWRSHKVAGPMVNITRHIHDIAAGKFDGQIRLRSGDELQALAGALNGMIESLRERDQTIKAGILGHVASVRTELERSDPRAAREALQDLARAIEQAYGAPASTAAEVEDLVHR